MPPATLTSDDVNPLTDSEKVAVMTKAPLIGVPTAVASATVGATVSSSIVAVAVVETLPAPSLNDAQTVFVPSPRESVSEAVVASEAVDGTATQDAAEQSLPRATRYATTPVASLAVSARVALVDAVDAAPPSIATEPVGAVASPASTVSVSDLLPAFGVASVAVTVKVELPAVVGVPERTPVPAASVSPAGSVPDVIDQA